MVADVAEGGPDFPIFCRRHKLMTPKNIFAPLSALLQPLGTTSKRNLLASKKK